MVKHYTPISADFLRNLVNDMRGSFGDVSADPKAEAQRKQKIIGTVEELLNQDRHKTHNLHEDDTHRLAKLLGVSNAGLRLLIPTYDRRAFESTALSNVKTYDQFVREREMATKAATVTRQETTPSITRPQVSAKPKPAPKPAPKSNRPAPRVYIQPKPIARGSGVKRSQIARATFGVAYPSNMGYIQQVPIDYEKRILLLDDADKPAHLYVGGDKKLLNKRNFSRIEKQRGYPHNSLYHATDGKDAFLEVGLEKHLERGYTKLPHLEHIKYGTDSLNVALRDILYYYTKNKKYAVTDALSDPRLKRISDANVDSLERIYHAKPTTDISTADTAHANRYLTSFQNVAASLAIEKAKTWQSSP